MLRIYLTVEDRDGTSKTDDNSEEPKKLENILGCFLFLKEEQRQMEAKA